ncbi:MAG: IS5 family transposase, partial [Candidatus Jordarchaeum sp.]
MDYFANEAFAEEQFLAEHLLGYVERFGKLPPHMLMGTKYGTQDNRDLAEETKVRASFRPRGRPPKKS